MRRSTGGRATNLEEDTRAANPEKDVTPRVMPSDYGAEAVVAATVDVITGAEDDIGSLATLFSFKIASRNTTLFTVYYCKLHKCNTCT